MSQRLVVLVYFKSSGKFYSHSAFTSSNESDAEIYAEIRTMRDEKRLPGINSIDEWEGYCLVDPEDGVRHLLDFTPDKIGFR